MTSTILRRCFVVNRHLKKKTGIAGTVAPAISPFHFFEYRQCKKHGVSETLNTQGGCIHCLEEQRRSERMQKGDELIYIYSSLLQAEAELRKDLELSNEKALLSNPDLAYSLEMLNAELEMLELERDEDYDCDPANDVF